MLAASSHVSGLIGSRALAMVGRYVIFLSGPMRNVVRAESIAWRQEITGRLEHEFVILDPWRGRRVRPGFGAAREAIGRDKLDIARSDILVVDDTHDGASMIGTAMEVFFAWSLNRFILVIGEAHAGDPWLDAHSHARVMAIEDAVEYLRLVFPVSA